MKYPSEFVLLPNGEDFLIRPVIRGMCKYESLKNGDLDLDDIALMNDGLDASDENERRMQEANRPSR